MRLGCSRPIAFLLASLGTSRCRHGLGSAFLMASSQRFGVHRSTKTFQRASSSSSSSSSTIRLRNATIEDLDLLVAWDEKPHLQDPDVMGDEDYNDWNWAEELKRTDLSWRAQLVAEIVPNKDGTAIPIGFVQVMDPALEETHYWGDYDCPSDWRALDVWIGEEAYLNQGCGTEMMRLALAGDYCFGDPRVQAAVVDPMAENPRAHRFYQKLGFVPQGKHWFGPDECLVHKLTREAFERGL